MPNFDIVRTVDIDKTFRVAHIMADFDVKEGHVKEHFVGDIVIPANWNIGIICGASGTGKSTIMNELFGEHLCSCEYTHKSVIDDMPDKCNVDEITKMFYAVGFGSVPSWLKPYSVLSNGEKMRVDIANALLDNDFVVFDEFTSVVDRNVAQVASVAIAKAVKATKKKFVAVSCHKDVIPWLQPDWVFDTDTMQMVFPNARAHKESLKCESAGEKNGKSLDDIII